MSKEQSPNDLTKVKDLIRLGKWSLTKVAERSGYSLGFSLESIKATILDLERQHFRKSVPDTKFPGQFQDHYAIRANGWDLFIKFKIWEPNGEQVLLLSFKLDDRGNMF